MRFDDGIPEQRVTEQKVLQGHEDSIRRLQDKYAGLFKTTVHNPQIYCVDLGLLFSGTKMAHKTLRKLGHRVTRAGIGQAVWRATKNGYGGVHCGLQFRHTVEAINGPVLVGDISYLNVSTAALRCGCKKADIEEAIRRGNIIRRYKHRVSGYRGHRKNQPWNLVVDGKPFYGGLQNLIKDYHIERETMDLARGYFFERRKLRCQMGQDGTT